MLIAANWTSGLWIVSASARLESPQAETERLEAERKLRARAPALGRRIRAAKAAGGDGDAAPGVASIGRYNTCVSGFIARFSRIDGS
jgi:hypothetical protein